MIHCPTISPLVYGKRANYPQRQRIALLLERYRLRFEQHWYVAGFYIFSAQPPFAPRSLTSQPILTPQRSDERLFTHSLNKLADRSVFPTGGVLQAMEFDVNLALLVTAEEISGLSTGGSRD